jgi:hypothetical protein
LEAKEYTKETTNGLLKKTSPNEVNLPNKDLLGVFKTVHSLDVTMKWPLLPPLYYLESMFMM